MRDFIRGLFKFVLGVAVVAAAVIGILFAFFIKKVDVGHNAMAPTIMLGDSVLVWKTTEFEIGEVALCPHPSEPGRYVMGRVVARSGQRIAIERNVLRINGDNPDTDYHNAVTFNDLETGRSATMVWADEDILDHDHRIWFSERTGIPEYRDRPVRGGTFLMSDNRSYRGEDSRTFGVVHLTTCIGRVFMRLTAGESPPEIGNEAFDIIE